MTAEKLSVAIYTPAGNPHVAGLREVADTVFHGLRALGRDVAKGVHADRRAIILAPHLLPTDPPAGSILYNLEQVSADAPWLTAGVVARYRRFEVWDYDERNAAALVRLGVRAKVVPVGFVPEIVCIPERAPEFDVLFYGSMNPRREEVLTHLRREGVDARWIWNVYGAERDEFIARAKLVLNVHFYAAKVFEAVRVSYLLANRVAVVSEDPVAPEFESAVAWAPYDGLVDVCKRLLANHAARRSLAERGAAIMRARPEAEYLRTALA